MNKKEENKNHYVEIYEKDIFVIALATRDGYDGSDGTESIYKDKKNGRIFVMVTRAWCKTKRRQREIWFESFPTVEDAQRSILNDWSSIYDPGYLIYED